MSVVGDVGQRLVRPEMVNGDVLDATAVEVGHRGVSFVNVRDRRHVHNSSTSCRYAGDGRCPVIAETVLIVKHESEDVDESAIVSV